MKWSGRQKKNFPRKKRSEEEEEEEEEETEEEDEEEEEEDEEYTKRFSKSAENFSVDKA